MNIVKRAIVSGLGLCCLAGCGVDLQASNPAVVWYSSAKTVSVDVANVGTEPAGPFMVYINPEEHPISSNHRPQYSERIDGLDPGQTQTLHADFAPMAHPDNDNLGRVYGIRILVDAKHEVEETDEGNNDLYKPLPTATLPDLIVTDIEQEGPYYLVVKYMNIGAAVTGEFLISIASGSETFPGNSLYPWSVPPPGVEQQTGGFTIGLIGLAAGDAADVTAIIDWEGHVTESDETNNSLTKHIVIE